MHKFFNNNFMAKANDANITLFIADGHYSIKIVM